MRLTTTTIALGLALLCLGCGPETQPIKELIAPEFQDLLEDPEAPYYFVTQGRSLGSKVLAPESMSEVDFGSETFVGLAQGFPEYLELRVVFRGFAQYAKIERLAMALFKLDAMPEVEGEFETVRERTAALEQELLRILDEGQPYEKKLIPADEDGLTFVGEFRLPPGDITWFEDEESGRESAQFLVSLFLETEDDLIVSREMVEIRAREEEKPTGPR